MSQRGPLAGLVVLDFTQLLPGPFCTRLLADLGARVVKVEPPWGERLAVAPPTLPDGAGAAYAALNHGKEIVRLDLRATEGKAAALELAAAADALVEGFRPGVMDRLGLGFAAVKAVKPDIVYCSLTGYGQHGPYAQRAGHDVNYLALAGLLGLGGPADGPPLLPAMQVADVGGGSLMAAFSIVAALLGRERGASHERGQQAARAEAVHLDVSMVDGAMSWMPHVVGPAFAGGPTPMRGQTTLNGGAPCYGIYETADGRYMALGALEAKFWEGFCTAAGRPDLIERQHERPPDRLAAELRALFLRRTQAVWTEVFADAECCCTPVLDWDEVWADPHVRARALLASPIPGLQTVRHPVLWNGEAPSGD
jgi:crotonobetainyl-CoA:carnitine CoA-transferase CaiB-like acyl-CoA transferase